MKYEIDHSKRWFIKVTNKELFYLVGIVLKELGFKLFSDPNPSDKFWSSSCFNYIGNKGGGYVEGILSINNAKEFTVNDIFDGTLMEYVKKEEKLYCILAYGVSEEKFQKINQILNS